MIKSTVYRFLQAASLTALFLANSHAAPEPGSAPPQEAVKAPQNSIESLDYATLQSGKILLTLKLKQPLKNLPAGFAINNPPRIALDFPDAQIENQAARNDFLDKEIKKLDNEIAEIKVLKEQTQAMLGRKQVVETLQSNRSAVVYLLDQLVHQLPEGVYLKSIKQNGNDINLQGYAQSNARVATLMRNLEASPWLDAPNLVETKAASVNNLRVSEFSVNVKLVHKEKAVGGKPEDKKK
ncbi:MAG: PilN domain-containing protein [Gammaproteobacteria bacterium]|nr:PilN domain-containing protein [Gammaproteobacteria bacterium]